MSHVRWLVPLLVVLQYLQGFSTFFCQSRAVKILLLLELLLLLIVISHYH